MIWKAKTSLSAHTRPTDRPVAEMNARAMRNTLARLCILLSATTRSRVAARASKSKGDGALSLRPRVTCTNRAECAALATKAIAGHAISFGWPNSNEVAKMKNRGCLCNLTAILESYNKGEFSAEEYWRSCKHGVPKNHFCREESRIYWNMTWMPPIISASCNPTSMGELGPKCTTRERLGGMACNSMTRFGPPLGEDGGKMLCEADTLLRSSSKCLVVSVGLRDDTRFEQTLHRSSPHCEIVAMDGTLSSENAKKVPPFVRFLPQNFDPTTYAAYANRNVRLLKIDCDGCEYKALPPWIDNVCTEQIVIEMHRRTFDGPLVNTQRHHKLMVQFHRRGFRIAFMEPNPLWPKLGTEYTLVRNTTCD